MDLKIVKKFINLAKKEGVSALSYEVDGVKLKVELPIDGQRITPLAKQSTISLNQATDSEEASLNDDFYEVVAPFVGTFYSSASPNDPNFVAKGAKVSKGDTLCILEAMKIMNEIESEESGEIIEVCVENEEFVEFGQVLFRIQKS